MPRNLVVCLDGTNNEFGTENTNVVRLVQSLDRDPERQLVYYDPGVGTLPEPGAWSAVEKWFSKVFGLAFGLGLNRNVEEAYSFLAETWQPGDRVYLFGFSRGAYTARVLAGMLHQVGLLPAGNQNLVPYAVRLFGAARQKSKSRKYWRVCNAFRGAFARPVSSDSRNRRFPIHFLGVWDTVSSVGWVWNPKNFPYTRTNPSIGVVRHAVALDERRWFFRQNLLKPAKGQDFAEHWFPGVHSDVGGGYREDEGRLWHHPFGWMLYEARRYGLWLDMPQVERVLNHTPRVKLRVPKTRDLGEPWTDPQHESLRGWWRLAEFYPKKVWRETPLPGRMAWGLGLGRYRQVPLGAVLNRSVLLRIREPGLGYAPPNLSPWFLSAVRSLADVPAVMTYGEGDESDRPAPDDVDDDFGDRFVRLRAELAEMNPRRFRLIEKEALHELDGEERFELQRMQEQSLALLVQISTALREDGRR